jgi:Na+/H+ antiporter NhaD/arsenite permease-like protein
LSIQFIFVAFFILAYFYIAFASRYRGPVVWAGAVLAVAFSRLAGFPVDIGGIFASINWNILLVFSGILFSAEVLLDAGIPAHLAGRIIGMSRNYGWAALLICGLSSFISIFVENVATVMIVAPIAFEVCRRHGANPVPLLIGVAIASNLQGTGTLVGDPPSMILAASENMGFNDFFVMNGKPGIFWAVQLGAAASFFVLYHHLGRDRGSVPKLAVPKVVSWIPAWILAAVISALAVTSVFNPGVHLTAGLICMGGGAVSLAWYAVYRRKKGHLHEDALNRKTRHVMKAFDLDTLLLLAGVFFMVGALDVYGVMGTVGRFLAGMSGGNPLTAFVIIVAGSMVFSAFVDNVPFVTAMIPVTRSLALSLGHEAGEHLYLTFGLLIGSCLGGNISPVGAAANIISVSLLRRHGYRVSFWQFVRIGLPFTLAATAAGAAFIWLVWKP